MNKYVATIRLGWMDAVEYRTEFFVSLLGWGIRLFTALFLWLAVVNARGGNLGTYSFAHIINYFFIIQIISSFIFSRVGFDIAHDIYRGDFANYMLKPINYIFFRMTHEMSKNIFRTLLSVIIFAVPLTLIFGGIPLPAWKIPIALLAMAGAYIINFCLVCIISLSAFWIVNATRITFIYFGILTIFSGMILPLDLFPPRLIALFQLLPFPYIFFFPAKVLQAQTLDDSITHGLAVQAIYSAILCIIVYAMYKRGVKHFEAVGR